MEKNVTETINFYAGNTPQHLLEKYGSPLYVYNESILRQRCREVRQMCAYKNFRVNYSAKANSNLSLLKIILGEGLDADAMSPGEIFLEQTVGFSPENIFFIPNNVSIDEMRYAQNRGITTSMDSLSQLFVYCQNFPNSKVALRINPGIGAGHSEKVITGGKKTKFAINYEDLPQADEICKNHNVKIVGLNQHIGSCFMDCDSYLQAAENTLSIAQNFPDLEFVDLGGGFGIPYKKSEGQARLELVSLGAKLDKIIENFIKTYKKAIIIRVEPGRYISAECGALLGTVHAIKTNSSIKYIGTDIGFNVLARPMLYDSWHDIEVYNNSTEKENITVVGNICETGDILAKDRLLPTMEVGDVFALLDTGAYGMSMASNYNCRLLPAEVLIHENGETSIIRARDTFEDLLKGYST